MWARFSAPVQTGPGVYPASYTMGTGCFTGVKRPGRGVDHPPASSAEVEGRVELYICSPSGLSWPVLGRILRFTFTVRILVCLTREVPYLALGRLFSPMEDRVAASKGIEQKDRSQGNPLRSSPNISHSDYRQYYSNIPRTTPSLGDAFV